MTSSAAEAVCCIGKNDIDSLNMLSIGSILCVTSPGNNLSRMDKKFRIQI